MLNSIKTLILEYETTEVQGQALQKMFDSSPEPTFQIERSSLENFPQDFPLNAISNFSPQIVILFISGLHVFPQTVAVLPAIRLKFSDVPILAVMETNDSQAIHELLELGADDFSISPVHSGEILLRTKRLLEKSSLEDLVSQSIKENFGLKQLIGKSPSFLTQVNKIPMLAKSDAIILITGETGTGKDLCARAIHYLSPRSRSPFMPINCGAIPVDLLENELFGHEKGAFTGASESRTGLIAEAEGGTIFLDEVDSLSLAAQVKLLRFLQEKEYRPLGSKKTKKADVRLLAAMNTDPEEALASGRLRQDLYYRLSVIPLVIPPLRDRGEDIPLLARHFLLKYSVQFNKPMADFSPEAMQLLQYYNWPGNVRELEHHVERAVVLSENRIIQASDILLGSSESDLQVSFHDAKMKIISAFERTYIERLLLAHHGNISQAARAAQKNRRAFWELIRKYQIDADSYKI